MLPVRRSRGYTRWFSWYSRRQFKKYFHAVRAFVPVETRNMQAACPVLFYCNHAYWWDGFWSQLCTEMFFRQNLYIIIEYSQLVKYRFFTRLGAFSLDRQNSRSAMETVDYAAARLAETSGKQNALWIFPQGVIEHVDKKPLHFYNGASSIVDRVLRKISSIYLVSVVSRIEYLEEQRPELFLSFGSPELVNRDVYDGKKELTVHMQNTTDRHLSDLKRKIIDRDTSEFQLLVKGAESVNTRVDVLKRFWRSGRK